MKETKVEPGYLFSKGYSYYIFGLLFLLYMFDYIDRMVISSLFPFLKADWNLTDKECGMLMSVVYISIVVFTFPISMLVDRWSRKKTIGIMAIVWGIATGLGAFSKSYRQLFSTRTIIGIGEAGYSPGGSAMMSALFPVEKRALMIGLWNASIPLGSAIGVAIGGIIAAHWGWRHALGIVSIPVLITAILFFFIKDYKTVELKKTVAEASQLSKHQKMRMSVKDMLKEFLSKPSLLFTYFGMAGVVFATTSLITWLPTYFHRVQGMAEGPAGMKASAVMLLAIVGAPLGGYVADRWRRKQVNARLLVPTLTSLISAILMFLAFNIFDGQLQYLFLLSVGVSVTAFIAAAAAVTQDVVHPGLRAMSYAIAVIIQNLLGSTPGPIAMGAISDATNIQTAFAFLPISLLISTVLFFLGSRYYERDMKKVEVVNMEVVN
jgi:MFS family permease